MTHTDVEATVRKCLKAWGGDAQLINDGMCGAFSEMVVDWLGGETDELYESFTAEVHPGHQWITFRGKHYDAEAPTGVDAPENLPWFNRLKPSAPAAGATGKA